MGIWAVKPLEDRNVCVIIVRKVIGPSSEPTGVQAAGGESAKNIKEK